MTKELKEFIIEGTKEYIDKDCCVTIEMSLHKDSINDVFDFIDGIEIPKGHSWVAYECETCRGYHGDDYMHLEIEEDKWIKEYINPNDIIRKSK